MPYCFRIRFRLPDRIRLGSDELEWTLTAPEASSVVRLRSTTENQAIKDAGTLVVRGDGYSSEKQAQDAVEQWRHALQMAFGRRGVGADFGDRSPAAFFTATALREFEERTGQRFLNDVHGAMVFECKPAPVFVTIQGPLILTAQIGRVWEAIVQAAVDATRADVRERLAFDLYSASFFQPSADARFLMLMMALETLLDPQPRPQSVQDHVTQLLDLTESAALPEAERASITGSLRWLYRESVGQAGRRLAHTLGKREYMGKTAPAFFSACYELRSQLVHGHMPRPSRDDVDVTAANLELFVGHLLSGPLLDSVAD